MTKICKVNGCNRKQHAKGYCIRHYAQLKRCDRIFGNPKKIKQGNPNRHFFENNICKIELYNTAGDVIAHTIIDTEDYDKIRHIRWCLQSEGYVVSGNRDGNVYRLHRVILGISGTNIKTDHADRDLLNNRKSNLRACTHQQNTCNRKKSTRNTSGYKGVSLDKRTNKWRAYICVNGNQINLGLFNNNKEAAKVYNKAAIKHHREFASLNQI